MLNPIVVIFELAVPFLPIFAAVLSGYVIFEFQKKEIRLSSAVIN